MTIPAHLGLLHAESRLPLGFGKICGVVAVTMVLAAVGFYAAAKAYIIHLAETDVQNLLLAHKGIHTYVQEVMHPALYQYQAQAEIPKTFYAPELFSSSFIVRNQHAFYNRERKRLSLPELYYKLAALNPRNPLNQADRREADLIKRFNADRAMKKHREIIDFDGKKFLFVALPFLENTLACLKCHGKREDSPFQLQSRYPGQGGFNEKVGDIRAIISIKAPLQREYTSIFVIAATLLFVVSVIFGLLLFNFRLRKTVSQRTQWLEREIFERKHSEEQTALAFERFKVVLDGVDALVYAADMNTYELLFVNQYGRANWGEITGKICWQTLQAGQPAPCPFCTNRHLLTAEGKPAGIYVWETQNTVTGEWFECRDQAIRWTDGRLVRLEIAVNITGRKLADTALAKEKELLAVTLASIADGVVTTDAQGRIILTNQEAEKLTGWKNTDAMGRPIHEVVKLLGVDSRAPRNNPVEQAIALGTAVEFLNDYLLISRNGQERNIAGSSAAIKDKDGGVDGAVFVFRDISAQLRTEQERLKSNKLESLGVLAGGLAHDFNNILTVMIGNLNLVLEDPGLPDETRTFLKEAEDASLRARNLTYQLLTFAKGGAPITKSAALEPVIRESADFVLHGGKVISRYSIPTDLWFVNIDKGQISQVIQNLVLNAVQAMPDGGIIEILCENVIGGGIPGQTAPRKDSRYVRVDIIDSGSGIPADIVDRIFDPYFSTKQQGNGLGLAICHSIVTKHGGQMSVQSTLGRGTVFSLYLPALDSRSVSDQYVEEEQSNPAGKRILVMDDESQVRKMLQVMLMRMGHAVHLVQNGEEAVQAYQDALNSKRPMDLIIMDLTIPGGMGGKETIRKILDINPLAKVIVASGYAQDPIMASYRDYGFCGAMEKPFETEDLKKIIQKVFAMERKAP